MGLISATDDSEQETLLEILNDASLSEGASPSEKPILTDALREPVDPHTFPSAAPAHGCNTVYAAAILVGKPDNDWECGHPKSLGSDLGSLAAEISNFHTARGKSEFFS